MYSKITVRIGNEKIFFGPGIAQLLENIETTGSVKEAAQKMDLSYTKAFRILNVADSQLGKPLITRLHGGKDGGKAYLTDAGKDFLAKYTLFNQDIEAYAKKRFADIF